MSNQLMHKKIKNSKSGTIPKKFVKDVLNEISPSLTVLFNNSLSLGIFLENLKIAIYKGEDTSFNPDNYRPISVYLFLPEYIPKSLFTSSSVPLLSLIFTAFNLDLGKNIPKHISTGNNK